MARTRRRRDRVKQYLHSHGINTVPGSMVANPDAPQPVITVIAYGPNDFVEKQIESPKDIEQYTKKFPVTWVNVDGFGDLEKIKELAAMFKIHNLAMEDVLALHQRAKVETYDNQFYIVAHMLEWHEEEIRGEQLNIFLGKNWVVTFQNGPIDCMNPARDRIRKKIGKLRSSGPDYLAYTLLDTVIDTFFPILETYGDSLENLEEEIIEKPTRRAIAKIHRVKRELLVLRRAIWPLREAINSLIRDTPDAFTPETIMHLRDCYDHSVQILDFIETYRELSADLQDVYLSSMSNRMNEIMKVLTIVSTLCVPPTLVAGIYGMNFDTKRSPFNMPELNWYFGYPFALGLMLVIVVITLMWMWSKGWLGDNSLTGEDISQKELEQSDKTSKTISLENAQKQGGMTKSMQPASTQPEGTQPKSTQPEGKEQESKKAGGNEPVGKEQESKKAGSNELVGKEQESKKAGSKEPVGKEQESKKAESKQPEGKQPENKQPQSTPSKGAEPAGSAADAPKPSPTTSGTQQKSSISKDNKK